MLTEPQAKSVPSVLPVPQEQLVPSDRRVRLVPPAELALTEPQDLTVLMEPTARQVPLASQEEPARLVQAVLRDLLDRPATLGNLA